MSTKATALLIARENLNKYLVELLGNYIYPSEEDKRKGIHISLGLIPTDKILDYTNISQKTLEIFESIPTEIEPAIGSYFKHIDSFVQEGVLFQYFHLSTGHGELFNKLKETNSITRFLNNKNEGLRPQDFVWKNERKSYAQPIGKDKEGDAPQFIRISNPWKLPGLYKNVVNQEDVLFRWYMTGHPYYFKNSEEGTLGIPWGLVKMMDWVRLKQENHKLPIVF